MTKKKRLSLKHKKAISKALIRYHSKCKLCLNRSHKNKKSSISNNRREYIKKRIEEIKKNQERRKQKSKK